jgi:tocopherol O-methyltransferase
MEDKRRFFAEAARVLRPGGRLVVCAWLACDEPSRRDLRHLLEPICREGRLPSMGTEQDYRRLAAAAGLEAVAFDDLSRQVRRTWSICARRVGWKLLTDGGARRMALDREVRNRVFLLTLPRMMIAFRKGALRYGVFAWRKPEPA